ncbi:hypothetical protein [Prosthecomicrobium sp. N25]|uniref:hypothetical protein n=1 Tax=Prosthecomicrobium sp. N25 TaxID=3129254 RepID=UPI003076A064
MRAWMFGVVALAAGVAAGPAMADSIDGKWCRKDGRRMEISGSTIITPGGTSMQGDYTRHAFRYRVPDQEEFGGTVRFLRLNGEDWVYAYPADQPAAEPEVWERCRLVS